MNQIANLIRSKLHQGTCPGQGARGELIAIEFDRLSYNNAEIYYARLYVWDDKVTGREVADWFKEAGAAEVVINQQIHDEVNDISEGLCSDGVRSWDINFATSPANPIPQPPTIRVARFEWKGYPREMPAQDLLNAIGLESVPETLTITFGTAPNPYARAEAAEQTPAA